MIRWDFHQIRTLTLYFVNLLNSGLYGICRNPRNGKNIKALYLEINYELLYLLPFILYLLRAKQNVDINIILFLPCITEKLANFTIFLFKHLSCLSIIAHNDSRSYFILFIIFQIDSLSRLSGMPGEISMLKVLYFTANDFLINSMVIRKADVPCVAALWAIWQGWQNYQIT